ncbi:MAG: alpha-amylase family protein [Paramuribaculum sp.]|nr:alpha-amylase family protein [Paramuribaculum sp.]
MNHKPNIYQLLPRLFSNDCENPVVNGTIEQNGSGKLNHITEDVIKSIAELGVNTIWYTGVIEHAQATDYSEYGILPDNPYIVKGKAGSPYAIKDYYDIDPDIAEDVPNRMKEFEALVERTHRCGLKVAIDFVPNHLARQYHSDAAPDGVVDFGVNDDREMFFSPSNNFYYITRQQFAPQFDCGSGSEAYIEFPAKASGNDCFTAFPGRNDWYETVKLNYGVDYGNGSHHFDPIPPTWIMMRDILLFWASKKIDYLRCDMVHMVPLEFWHWAIAQVKEQYPELKFIAEIYEPALYRPYINYGGFDYLYDKVGLYDTLRAIQTSDTSAATITNCWQTVEGISDKMLHFLENHDEQRFASPQYAGNAMLAIPSLVVSAMISKAPMMIYMGQELGERALEAEGFSGADGRTTIFDYWSLDTLRRWLNGLGPLTPGEKLLTRDEKELRHIYSRILHLAANDPALAQGCFFDLMYVNYQNPQFNPHHQYTFLRVFENEVVVVAVNFDSSPVTVHINIPEHAFTTLGLKPSTEVNAEELLSGHKSVKPFTPEKPFVTSINAYSAAVWKLILPE